MNQFEKLAAIDKLLTELTRQMKEYNDCLNRDETLEIKKKIRLRIKEIEKELSELKKLESQNETQK